MCALAIFYATLGLISMFPGSKFIHIYRSGPSVVESFLRKEWRKYSDYFISENEYRLRCANYWNDCILEIERQKYRLPLGDSLLFEFSYENLCEYPVECLGNLAEFLMIDPDGFSFDLAQIVSQNYKVGNFAVNEKWNELLKVMSPGMELKGYF